MFASSVCHFRNCFDANDREANGVLKSCTVNTHTLLWDQRRLICCKCSQSPSFSSHFCSALFVFIALTDFIYQTMFAMPFLCDDSMLLLLPLPSIYIYRSIFSIILFLIEIAIFILLLFVFSCRSCFCCYCQRMSAKNN